MPSNQEQRHPLELRDRAIVDLLLQGEPNDYNLVELARLRIRYLNFPGAKAIQNDLDKILNQWQLTEDELFAKTRQIHAVGKVYKTSSDGEDQQDWN